MLYKTWRLQGASDSRENLLKCFLDSKDISHVDFYRKIHVWFETKLKIKFKVRTQDDLNSRVTIDEKDFLQWEYLERNLKADVNILVLLNLRVYENWRRHAK